MQIGRLFGLTAPSLFMTGASSNEIIDIVDRINYSANADIVRDFKKELLALANLDKIAVYSASQSLNVDSYLTQSWEELTNSADSLTATSDVKLYLMQSLAALLVEAVQDGETCKEFELQSIQSSLESMLENGIGNSDEAKAEDRVRSIVDRKMKILRTFRRELIAECDASESVESISKKFNLKACAPDSIVLIENGVEKNHKLTDLDKSIFNFFLDKKSEVLTVFNNIGVAGTSDQTIFDVSFEDLIYRKPVSIMYQVSNRFSTINDTNRENLISVLINVRSEIDMYEKLIASNVETFDSKNVQAGLTEEEYYSILNSFSHETKCILESVRENSGLNFNDLTEADVKYLATIADVCQELTVASINAKFGVSLSKDEWFDEFERLSYMGIYGLNTDSAELFEERFSTVIMTDSVKIKLPAEKLDEIRRCIADVRSLLDTLIPFGEEL